MGVVNDRDAYRFPAPAIAWEVSLDGFPINIAGGFLAVFGLSWTLAGGRW